LNTAIVSRHSRSPKASSPYSSSTPRRTGQDVLEELVTGFQRLVLSRDIKLGSLLGTGGYAEVYEGVLTVEKTGKEMKVAVKRFRLVLSKEKEFAKVCRELGL
jgi:serine/threonine-protein kinase RIO1